MTPAQLLGKFGIALILIGSFISFFNWVYIFMNISNQRRGIDRHVSMVGCLGLCLPLGCLLIAPLRWHALWVVWLDPFFVYLLRAIPELIRNTAFHIGLSIQWMIEEIKDSNNR